MSKTISIYVDQDTLELLDKTAEKEDRSRSNLIKKVLYEYVKKDI